MAMLFVNKSSKETTELVKKLNEPDSVRAFKNAGFSITLRASSDPHPRLVTRDGLSVIGSIEIVKYLNRQLTAAPPSPHRQQQAYAATPVQKYTPVYAAQPGTGKGLRLNLWTKEEPRVAKIRMTLIRSIKKKWRSLRA